METKDEIFERLRRIENESFRRYTLTCRYNAGKLRKKTRTLIGNLTWPDACALRDKLQARAAAQGGIGWTAWAGRVYALKLEPVFGQGSTCTAQALDAKLRFLDRCIEWVRDKNRE